MNDRDDNERLPDCVLRESEIPPHSRLRRSLRIDGGAAGGLARPKRNS
jgi:hypothetical protein